MTNFFASLVDELYQLGVREVVLSPGSRSTPMALLFCEHDFNIYMNIDERSAAYFGLGIAKAKDRPVVLVCTSGSAAANYLPAIMEAKHARVPLIILTADRPHELRNCGAPQTVDQLKVFSGYVNYFEELALADDSEKTCHYVRSVMDRAYSNAIADGGGVSHVNVPIREPLIPDFEALDFTLGRRKIGFRHSGCMFEDLALDNDLKDKKGIILCGSDITEEDHEYVLNLAHKLKAPIIADPLSNLRNCNSAYVMDSYDAFLNEDIIKNDLKPDYIIQLGQIPVSKRIQQFLDLHQSALYIQVDITFEYRNPVLSTNVFIKSSIKGFLNTIHIKNQDDSYLKTWQKYQSEMRFKLNSVERAERLFEGKIVRCIQNALTQPSNLVVANSMSIRYIDHFYQAKEQNIQLFCNRGTNGIEGIVSTALGISTTEKPTVLLTGDLSFYHDLNGLLIGKTHALNLVIVLLNNDGGGIFQLLPQREERHFDTLFATSHGLNFQGLSMMYGIDYFNIKDYGEFEDVFRRSLCSPGIQLIEVKLDPEKSKQLYDRYTSYEANRCI